jgi:hypothetical protein
MSIRIAVAKSHRNALVMHTQGGVSYGGLARPRPESNCRRSGVPSRQNVTFVNYPTGPFD